MAMNGVGVCGVAALVASSLAVVSLGFWEGDACEREGSYRREGRGKNEIESSD
jgi:hypothetical protein